MSFFDHDNCTNQNEKKIQFKIHKSIYADFVQKNKTESYYTLNF